MSKTCVELPIIDISQPLSESDLSSLYAACNEWGFFYITNHGISKDFYQKLIFQSNTFFALPQETKLKVDIFSYVPRFFASPFYESLKVTGPDFLAAAQSLAKVVFSNQQNIEFSNLIEEYGSKMTDLSKRIMKILLMSLGDDFQNKFYESEFSNCRGNLRLNNYSLASTMEEEELEGLGKHTDISCITILFQDDIGGLQMRSKEGNWMDIRPCENALVVNIGDFMQAWSNGKLRSAEHRVVLKRNRNVNRFSASFFWSHKDDKEIYAPKEVVGEESKRLYRPFSSEEYLMFRATLVKANYDKVGATLKDFAGIC